MKWTTGRVATALLLIALAGITAWAWPQLPARIPTHFDAAGTPDGWGGRSMFLVLPMIGFASVLLISVIGRFAMRDPRYINIPRKKELLALPAEEQRWVLEPMVTMLDVMATLMAALFLVIQIAIWRSALGHESALLLSIGLYSLIGAMLMLPIVYLVKLLGRIDLAIRRARGMAAPLR